MRKQVAYEWCIEEFTPDESEDIIELYLVDELEDFSPGMVETLFSDKAKESDISYRLVLVRSEGNQYEGVTDRLWAYVRDGQLPLVFEDAMSEPTDIKVPQRFIKELDTFNKKNLKNS